MKMRLLTLTLALLMILSLSACGGKDEPAPAQAVPAAETDTQEPQTPEPAAQPQYGTKTMEYFSEYVSGGPYTMEMKTEYGGISSTTLTAYAGDSMYSESESDGVKSIVIMKGGFQYILDPASKTCIKMSAEMMQDAQELFAEDAAGYETAVSSGDMEVNGVSCFYEEFTVEDMSVKYCFVDDELKYILTDMGGELYTVEVLRMERGVDQALFEVPDDYTIMEY